jgi:hypothetical protein
MSKAMTEANKILLEYNIIQDIILVIKNYVKPDVKLVLEVKTEHFTKVTWNSQITFGSITNLCLPTLSLKPKMSGFFYQYIKNIIIPGSTNIEYNRNVADSIINVKSTITQPKFTIDKIFSHNIYGMDLSIEKIKLLNDSEALEYKSKMDKTVTIIRSNSNINNEIYTLATTNLDGMWCLNENYNELDKTFKHTLIRIDNITKHELLYELEMVQCLIKLHNLNIEII